MIRLRQLTRTYGTRRVVDGVDLDVAQGELVVLLGASGCGKTTTLKMINRLVEPTSGEVRIGGEDAAALPPHELRRRIGYVFQQIGLFPHMSVAENVGITPSLLGWPAERIRHRTDELLDMVGLDPSTFRNRPPSALSGGQQQRVGVARALAAEPEVLLLDEPFGALDAVTRERLQESFRELRLRLGVTAIFVTHDVIEALVLADRIAVMDAGRLVQVGAPREVLEHPASPVVEDLLQAPVRQIRAVLGPVP